MFTISKCNEEHGDYFKALETLKGKYGSIVCPVTIPTSDGTGVIDLVHNVAYITKGSKTEKGAVPAADADHVEELRAEAYGSRRRRYRGAHGEVFRDHGA
ncbi:MAG: hypothetical protein V8S72_00260 [Oscillospiraceae bacterium]